MRYAQVGCLVDSSVVLLKYLPTAVVSVVVLVSLLQGTGLASLAGRDLMMPVWLFAWWLQMSGSDLDHVLAGSSEDGTILVPVIVKVVVADHCL